MNEYPDVHGQS